MHYMSESAIRVSPAPTLGGAAAANTAIGDAPAGTAAAGNAATKGAPAGAAPVDVAPAEAAPAEATQGSGSLRAARKARTQSSLIAQARALTLDKGLGGFTLDELCTQVGVSRRTFFNYFASKDDAVLGIPLQSPYEEHREEFLASRGTLALVDAIRVLLDRSFQSMVTEDFTPDIMSRVLVEQPTLIDRLHEHAFGLVRQLESLIVEREELATPSSFAHTVALTCHQLTMATFIDLNKSHTPQHAPRTALHNASCTLQTAVYSEALKRNFEHLTLFFTPSGAEK